MKGSLQIKSNKYYAVFHIDGKTKWVNLGVEASKGNKRKAETAMSELVSKFNSNPNMLKKTEFTEYVKKWLDTVKNQIDVITYEGYKQYATGHIIPYFEEKHIMLQDVSYAYRCKGNSNQIKSQSRKEQKIIWQLLC